MYILACLFFLLNTEVQIINVLKRFSPTRKNHVKTSRRLGLIVKRKWPNEEP